MIDAHPLRATICAALADDPALYVAERHWPKRGEHVPALPAAIVCGPDSPETPSALRSRLAQLDTEAGPVRFVVVVASDCGLDGVRALLTSGADGVVMQADIATALAPTIHAVCCGQLVVPHALAQSIARPVLTTREKQILGLVVLGFTNREIADQLVVAESTVKSHLFTAFRRLGVRTRKEATALILDPDTGLGSGILGISESYEPQVEISRRQH